MGMPREGDLAVCHWLHVEHSPRKMGAHSPAKGVPLRLGGEGAGWQLGPDMSSFSQDSKETGRALRKGLAELRVSLGPFPLG